MSKEFLFNPFSGVLNEDISKVIIPQFNINQIISKVETSDSLAIEFIGKKGRGKTSHLKLLKQYFPQYPIYLLNNGSSIESLMNDSSDVVFVDSIHHLSFLNRITLFKSKKVVVYTTHWSRKIDCYLAQTFHHKIKFKGINTHFLKDILNTRLELASASNSIINQFTENDTKILIKKYGDNYREIINHLYEKYQ
ncbi:MAG: hypothetical protein MK202_13415 [Tenacibaculum sp.]|nr:hypothetical protein [Tenacibaculum sp.]